jgi:hypothetical protein
MLYSISVVRLKNLILADFFFFEKVNKELARLNLVQETIYKDMETVSRTVAEKDFAAGSGIPYQLRQSVIKLAMDTLRTSKK